jgi:hypothetical protein
MGIASILALFDEVQKSESTLSTEFLNKIGYYYSRISNDYLAKERENKGIGGIGIRIEHQIKR